MSKAPEPGRVKTRLTPPLTSEEAATLNINFLKDLGATIASATRSTQARGVGVYTPVGSEQLYENVLPEDFLLIPQRGDSFGERLILASIDLFSVGFESVCLINSDSPTVPANHFALAVTLLMKTGDRVVLGPSEDGGYYLIGLKQLHRRLFEEIDWSTERVLRQTKARAAEIRVEVKELPIGLDVDDEATLQRLCEELFGSGAKSTEAAPHTRKFLSEIIAREGRARIWPKKS